MNWCHHHEHWIATNRQKIQQSKQVWVCLQFVDFWSILWLPNQSLERPKTEWKLSKTLDTTMDELTLVQTISRLLRFEFAFLVFGTSNHWMVGHTFPLVVSNQLLFLWKEKERKKNSNVFFSNGNLTWWVDSWFLARWLLIETSMKCSTTNHEQPQNLWWYYWKILVFHICDVLHRRVHETK